MRLRALAGGSRWMWTVLVGLVWSSAIRAEVPKPAEASGPVASFDAAWRILRDSYYDPTFHGLDWEAVRTELRPKAEAAKDVHELRGVIQEMLRRLGGSHMALIPKDVAISLQGGKRHKTRHANSATQSGKGNARPADQGDDIEPDPEEPKDSPGGREGDLGFEVRIVNGRVLISSVDPAGPAGKSGVKAGWIVQAVGGEPVDEMLQAAPQELEPARAQFVAWGQVKGKLAGRPGSKVTVEFLDALDQPVVLTFERRREQGEPTTLGYLPTLYAHLESQPLRTPGGGTVGLIRFNLWLVSVVQALDHAIDQFRSADGLIVDLRGNLGGLGGMILGISGHFLGERVSLGTLSMRGNELKFYSNPRRVNSAGQRVEPYGGPVAILIDPLSLSAAEIFAGGMQSVGRARVFGQTSGGQALPAIWDRLPNGDVLYHAVGDFVTASGERLEGRGVIPDQTAPIRREDLLAGRDGPLEAALLWIDQRRAGAKSGQSSGP